MIFPPSFKDVIQMSDLSHTTSDGPKDTSTTRQSLTNQYSVYYNTGGVQWRRRGASVDNNSNSDDINVGRIGRDGKAARNDINGRDGNSRNDINWEWMSLRVGRQRDRGMLPLPGGRQAGRG